MARFPSFHILRLCFAHITPNISGWATTWQEIPPPSVETGIGVSMQPEELCIHHKIDGFRSGYPQFSALTSAYDGFFVCRRFARLRARVLLAKQDRLSQLEHELDQVDQEESRPLFLGKMRGDLNTKRTELLGRIEDCLDNYDSFLEKTQRALRMQSANPKDVESLKNWIDGTGSLSSAETSYLGHAHDLVSLASCDDKATRQIENWLGMKFVNYFPKFREHIGNNTSDDPNVFLYNGTLITTITKMLVVWSVVLLFLFPIITCILISSPSQRIGVAVASIVVFIVASASLAELRTTELIITGATFATVMLVFVSGNTVTN